MILKILVFIVIVWALFVIAGFAAAALTGRVKRAYSTISDSMVIQIGDVEKPLNFWAETYVPVMMQRSKLPNPPLLDVLYEGVDQPDELVLVYYFVWADEIHPDPVYHQLYRLFRAAYYGYPVRDIEFFQIRVKKQSGVVSEVLFETTPGTDYFVRLSKHILARYTRDSSQFSLTLSEHDKKLISTQDNIEVQFRDQHVVAGVATWNHLTQMVTTSDPDFDDTLSAPLNPLTASAYQNGKYVRKGQGDFKTTEPAVENVVGLLSMVVVMGPIWLFYSIFFRNKRTGSK